MSKLRKPISALILGVALTLPLYARGPASAPATTRAATTPAVMQVETILKFFPANANSIASRSDARNFTLEGRVREVRTVTLPSNATEVVVYIVARAQPDDVAEHFSCHIEKASEADATSLKPDQIVRLTGAIGTVNAAADRIDIKACHDLSVTGTVTVGELLPGPWRDASVQVDGTALRKDNQAKGVRGAAAEAVPDAPYVSPYHLDLLFKSDNTLTAELRTQDTLNKRITGRWTLLKDGPEEAHLKLDITGFLSAEATATLEGKTLKLSLPGFADKFLLPDMSWNHPDPALQPIDSKALNDQILRWINTNTLPAQTQILTKYFSDMIVQAQNAQNGFVMSVGSGMLKRGKATYVAGLYGKLITLEYPDAPQALAAAKTSNSWAQLSQWGRLVTPEVKVESVVFDNHNAIDLSKPITGKVTLRALRRMPAGQYTLLLNTPAAASFSLLTQSPGPDTETFSFSFPPLASSFSINPRLAVFIIGRQTNAGENLFGDTSPRVIAEPIPMLLDLVK